MQGVKRAKSIIVNPLFWGCTALTLATVVGIVAAMVYVSPPGNRLVTFYTEDASSLTPGISVRIAGITVGKIKDLAIEQDRVQVRATVAGDVFVGDQSNVSVRMLTVVGGYYVNVDSLGDRELGAAAIPVERVTMPYSLVQALTDSTKITEHVQTESLRQSLDEVQQGLTGGNIETISAIVDAGTTLTETLDRQRGQVSSILDLSDEYIEQLSRFRGQLEQLIQKVAILEQTLVLYGKGFAGAMQGMGKILQGIGPLGEFYMNHRDKFLEKVINWQQIARTWADRNGVVVRILERTRGRLYQALDRQNAAPELLATDLCIPMPGSAC